MGVAAAKKKFYESHSPEAYKALQEALAAEQGPEQATVAPEALHADDVGEETETEHGSLNSAVLYESPEI